jgi:PD-(D/E)XK nuclease superfamily
VPHNNLLLALHTFAPHQDENFTTEAFVHLLRHLQNYEPRVACALFDFLTGEKLGFGTNDCSMLRVTTQWSFAGGTPDIVIEGPEQFVIVEVKVESEPGETQLDRYRERLQLQQKKQKLLTLLSRYPVDSTETKKVDVHIRWHGIGRLLNQRLSKVTEPISTMLINQFLEFLKERGMAMEKVGWELVRGVQALLSLMGLLEEAMVSSKDMTKRERLGGTSTNGFGFHIKGTRCWSGVYLSRPQVLVFEAYNVTEDAAQNTGVGRLLGKDAPEGFGRFEKQNKGVFKWVNELDLESEGVHFFALAPDNQQKRLEEFVTVSVSEVTKMTPG